MPDPGFLERLSRELADQGKLIEAGWIALRLAAFPPHGAARSDQLNAMRTAFFAGAQHLFGSINTILDPGEEPTDADLKRMDLIDKELKQFIAEYAKRLMPEPAPAPAPPPASSPPSLGDAPIEPAYVRLMNSLAGILDEAFNGEARGSDRKTGFVLWVFPFGSHEGRANYISNGADRRDIVTMMKEQIARFEGQPEVKGRA